MANDMQITDGSKVWLNEFDLSGALNTFGFAASRTVANTRTLNGNDMTAGSAIDPTFTFGGWAVYAANDYDEETFALMSNEDNSVVGALMGGAAGDVQYDVIGKLDSRTAASSVGNVNTVDGSFMGEWFSRGLGVDVDRALTTTGAGTGQNVGTVSAVHTLVARCTAFNGTSFVLDFEGSSDDGSGDTYAQVTGYTWITSTNVAEASDSLTFTGTGYAVGYKAAASAEAWVRTNVTAFTATSATLSTAAGEGIGQN